MNTRNILTSTVFAALAAASLVTATAQSASAQSVVAATCPQGYTLSGSNCVKSGPMPSCPSGYVFSAGSCVATVTASAASTTTTTAPATRTTSVGGQWAFVTREAFGVESAKEVGGANYCAVAGKAADAAKDFFKGNGLEAEHVEVADDRAGIETYQKYDCDLLVVADKVATSTVDNLKPKGDHIVLPEKFGADAETYTPAKKTAAVAPAAVEKQPEPVKAAPVQAAPQKAAPKQQARPRPARKVRCSAVRYGYTRGNTCGCAGGRVFNGHACVKPRWRSSRRRY